MILSAENVHVVRPGGAEVLRGAGCRIEPGKITGIIGPNGAGKSTLIKVLARLLPVASGAVTLDGVPLADWTNAALSRAIAYLPQERAVHWAVPVERIVALGRLPHRNTPAGHRSEADLAAVRHALRVMDLESLANRAADRISGGELARVLIARALAQEAPIVLADEPTAGLDPAHALSLFASFRNLAAEGRGIAVALHDLSLAARFCHQVVVLDEGRVKASGQAAAVMTASVLEPVFQVRFALGEVDGVPVVQPSAPSGG
ncbi:MAG TPA: ABC transporter ATP-binding protein [Hyphomicrobiaceae bacterium]|nr:ABC transporter ATP-binding protein [Hyphomicrobiaceae bacterium]